MHAYEKMLEHTDSAQAPWTVVPADHKWYRNYIVSQTLVDTLEKLPLRFPKAITKINRIR